MAQIMSRKFLAGLGCSQEAIDSIIEVFTERKGEYEDKIESLEKELADTQAKIESASKSGKSYEKLKEEFDAFKKEVADKETSAKKKEALTKIAKDAGLSEAGVAKAIKYFDLSQLELDEEGNAKNPNDIRKSIKEEWVDYVQTKKTEGAKTPTPPTNTNTSHAMSKADIMKIKDTTERQKAWGEYLKAQSTN